MTIQDFRKLDEVDKYQAIWNGTLLSSREVPGYTVQLHNVYEFYVEIFYSIDARCIEKVRAFRTTKLIEPYLQGELP